MRSHSHKVSSETWSRVCWKLGLHLLVEHPPVFVGHCVFFLWFATQAGMHGNGRIVCVIHALIITVCVLSFLAADYSNRCYENMLWQEFVFFLMCIPYT